MARKPKFGNNLDQLAQEFTRAERMDMPGYAFDATTGKPSTGKAQTPAQHAAVRKAAAASVARRRARAKMKRISAPKKLKNSLFGF